jgi:hypothetical protein
MSKLDDQNFEDYRLAQAKGRHIQVKAGDKVSGGWMWKW